jgi:hypothetical protein
MKCEILATIDLVGIIALQNSLLHNCLQASNLQYNDPYQVNGSQDFAFHIRRSIWNDSDSRIWPISDLAPSEIVKVFSLAASS